MITAALIKRILYLIAVVLTTAFVYLHSYLQEGVWLFASVLLFLNITVETTLLRRSLEIAATALVAAVLIFIGTLLASSITAQIFFHSIVTGCCVYMGAKYGKAAYPWFVVNVLAVLSLHTEATLAAAIHHASAVTTGAVIVLAAQIILLPFFNLDEFYRARKLTLYRLSRVSTAIFTCLIAPDYTDNVYLYERRVHKQKIKCLNKMAVLADREKAAGKPPQTSQQMQTLFEMIIDIGQIRRRVTDHTVFALCNDELSGIDAAIDQLLTALAGDNIGRIADGLLMLDKYINQFESNFEHILRVTAREPLVFVLMLSSLKALQESCRNISGFHLQPGEAEL